MAKKKDPLETDIKRLKEKVSARKAKTENAEGDASLRVLHKRLKRAQRKKRALASRLARAQGKKKEVKPAATPAAAPAPVAAAG
jgi:predicted  nucleic acid-binding Zn-ribbon protein